MEVQYLAVKRILAQRQEELRLEEEERLQAAEDRRIREEDQRLRAADQCLRAEELRQRIEHRALPHPLPACPETQLENVRLMPPRTRSGTAYLLAAYEEHHVPLPPAEPPPSQPG